jgi:hypothetical protein
MKHNKYPHEQTQKPANVPPPIDLVTSSDEVARKAYFTYVNQGSQPGHEVQHWLAAEAELIAERNLTRTHGFHNKT